MKKTALLIVDFFSDFQFEGGDQLKGAALNAARKVKRLKDRASRKRIPVVYVNDNFKQWRDDFSRQVEELIDRPDEAGKIARLLKPSKADYYVLKPQRSGFYETPLQVLLESLKVKRLVVTGLSTDICVLFTAHDAYVRGFELVVPTDCTAAIASDHKREALRLIRRVAFADTSSSEKIDL